ncbi:MAG: TolC family protein [Cyclobacteriaceae bacterium]
MIKRLYLIIAIGTGLITTQRAVAQDQPASSGQTFTLQQCIDYALENGVLTKNSKLDEQIAESKVRETVGIGLPQISANASVTHNEKLPRFFTTYTGTGGFIDLSAVPGIKVGDVVAAENFFQLKSSGDVGLSVNQIIFNGSYIVGLQASQAYKELAYKTTNQTKEQTIEAVTKAFYLVLINTERANLFTSNIARLDTLLRNTKALYQNGFAESIDADRIQVTLNNIIVQRDNFLKLNELGIEVLKFQMNYPMDQTLQVSGTIQDVQVNVDLASYDNDWDYKARPDYQLLEANKRLQELNIRNKRAASLPQLNAFLNYGYSTQSAKIAGLFKTESDISDAGGVGPDKWYNYSNYGVRLSMPIFTGLQNHHQWQQEKLSLQKINNQFTMLRSNIDLQIAQASTTYQNSVQDLHAQEQNITLATNVARVTKIKYEQGVGSNLEVVQAEDDLRQAQTNYYNSLYSAAIAKVDLDKAYGKLLPTSEKK